MAIKIFKRGNPGCTCCPTGGRGIYEAFPFFLRVFSTATTAHRGNLPLVLGQPTDAVQPLEEVVGLSRNSYAVGVDMESSKILIADGSESLGWAFYKIAHPWGSVEEWIPSGSDLEEFRYDGGAYMWHWPSLGYGCLSAPGAQGGGVASFDNTGTLVQGPQPGSRLVGEVRSDTLCIDGDGNLYTVRDNIQAPGDNLYKNNVLFGQAPYNTLGMWHDGTDLYASASVLYDGDVPQYGVWRIVSGDEPVFVKATGEIWTQLVGLGFDDAVPPPGVYYDYTDDSIWFGGWYAAPGFLEEDGKGILMMPTTGVPSFRDS